MTAEAPLPSCARTALFSRCGRYRYLLGRRWSDDGGRIIWIMLNPSRANGEIDDPTIRRCMSFSAAWGYGGLTVVNLFALCATDPDELCSVEDPVGPDNDRHIARVCAARPPARRPAIIAAWGAHPLARARARHVLSVIGNNIDCLGVTTAGHPRHPLYLPARQERTSYLPW